MSRPTESFNLGDDGPERDVQQTQLSPSQVPAGGQTQAAGIAESKKVGGSQIDLGSTVRGNVFLTGATIPTRKEHFYHLLWNNKHTTGTLCAVFWSFGMCVAFLGPTLLDLGCKTKTVFATMSWVFFSQSLFVLLGSACGGFFVQRISHYVLLVISIIMMCLTMAIIPFCQKLWVLAVVLAIMGFFMGTIDTVANVTMIKIYGKDVSPFLQALHFFYGVGAFVSPMIAQPFLLNEDCSPFIDNKTEPVHILDENETLPAATLEEAQRMTHIDYAFWIMSALMVPVVALSLTLLGKDIYQKLFGRVGDVNQNKDAQYEATGAMIWGRNFLWYQEYLPFLPFLTVNVCISTDIQPIVLPFTDATAGEKIENESPATKLQTILITLLCAALMFLYDGLQAIYGGYLYSYAVKGPVNLKKYDAAYLNALFWGMFATGRLISIALATRLAPAFMLCINIIGCTLGMLFMLAFNHSKAVLILGTCIMGVFMSSVFPTALSLTEQYIKVTPSITSFLVFGAALGEMSMPVILGHEFDRTGPIAFLVTGVVLCFLSLIVYIALWIIGHTVIRYAASSGVLGFLSACFPGRPSADGEDTGLTTQHVRYYSRMRSDLSESSLSEQYKESTFTEQPNARRP